MKNLLCLSALVGFVTTASAVIPAYDPFADATASGGSSYAVGAPGWHQTNNVGDFWYEVNSSGTAANTIYITNNSLTYSGLPASTGNSILLRNLAGPGMRMSVGAPIPDSSNGVKVYYSMLLAVSNVASLVSADYFFGVNNGNAADQTSQPSDLRARVYFKKNGAGYQLGISKNGGVQTNYDATVRNVGDTVFIVVSYEIVTTNSSGVTTATNDICRLWINPSSSTFGAASPPAENASILGVDANETTINTFVIENRSTTTPNMLVIDEFRIGTNWAFATGAAAVKTPPPASATVGFGNTLSLTNIATGAASLTYQWQFAGTNVAGATTSVLSVNNMRAALAGAYLSIVSSSVGSPITNNTVVTVTGDPSFVTQPSNQNVPTGGSTSFTVSAVGTPNLSYGWLENGNPVSDGTSGSGTVFSGAHTTNLILSSVAASENGSTFVCLVTNGLGTSVFSLSAMLTVQDPVVVTGPANVVTNYLSTAQFSVVTAGSAPLTYGWLYNGTPLTDGASPSGSGANISGSHSTTLTISGVTYLDSGSSYSVVVTNVSANTASSGSATLTVRDPYIATQPVGRTNTASSTIHFSVSASGTPPLNYQWYQNNNQLTDGNTVPGGGTIAGSTTATLTISSITDSNAGNYYVTISGGSGGTTNSLTVPLVVIDPITITLAPRSLTERVGDHLAFIVGATGTTPAYQWQFNGVNIAGATKSSLVLTNIQASTNGTYTAVVTNTVSTNSAAATLTVINSTVLPLAATNIVVARLGDGVQTLSGATGNTIYLDQYAPDGTYVSTIQVPDEPVGVAYGTGAGSSTFGSPGLLAQGAGADAPNSVILNLSGLNQQYLSFFAYCESYPFSGSDVTVGANGGANWRGIGLVNAFGQYSLGFTNTGLYSGGNHTARSAVTLDGTNFWTTGQPSSGSVKFGASTNSYPGGGGIPAFQSSANGARVVQIVGTNLVFSDPNGASGSGIYAAAGTPTPLSGTPGTAIILTEGGLPIDFAASPDLATVYIADAQAFSGTNAAAGGGGIQRWDTNGVGGWNYSYTLSNTASGVAGLSVYFPPNITTWGAGVGGAVIYATSFSASNNVLSKIVDNGTDSTPTPLVTAGPNQALRGVRFGPAAIPVTVAVSPQSQTNFPGNNVTFAVTPNGSAPFFYQWQFNGNNIAGATQSSFTTNNISFASEGDYSVIVSNLVPSTATSASAHLTVAAGAPVFTYKVQSYVETVGDHLAFTPSLSGTLPMSAQWYQNDTAHPVPGGTNFILVLTNIQMSQSGTYMLFATNIFGNASSTGKLTVTTSPQRLGSNNIVVARIGDGAQTLSGATGNTLYLDQYTTGGVYSNTIQFPDEGTGSPYGTGGTSSSALPFGSPALLVAGAGQGAGLSAFLTRSANGETIDFVGYCQAYPFAGADVTVGANGGPNWRGIGEVSAFGYYSVPYTNTGLCSSGNHQVHGAISLDQRFYFAAGEASAAGLKILDTHFMPASGGGVGTITTASHAGPRTVRIFNGNLVYCDSAAAPPGLYACAGTPTASSTSSLLLALTNNPMDFAISPDNNTIYVADANGFGATSTPGGGIQRWDSDGAGGYAFSYTLGTGTGSTVGGRGLAVDFSAQSVWGNGVIGAVLYATTAEAAGNRLIKITDNGASSSATLLATTAPGNTLAGVDFGPAAVPVSIATDPQNQTAIVGGSATFTAAIVGSNPIGYQWYFRTNGVGPGGAIVGATSTTLTLNSVTAANLGNYYIVATNPVPSSAQSADASLTLVPPPSFSTNNPPPIVNLGPGNGFQLNFSGPSGFGYTIYTSTNVALQPIPSTWTKLTTNIFSGGLDNFTDSSGGANRQQFYMISVP
jgi:hypothetical protein